LRAHLLEGHVVLDDHHDIGVVSDVVDELLGKEGHQELECPRLDK